MSFFSYILYYTNYLNNNIFGFIIYKDALLHFLVDELLPCVIQQDQHLLRQLHEIYFDMFGLTTLEDGFFKKIFY